MNPIKAFFCRTVQFVLRAALPVLPYREPEIFRSCGELNARMNIPSHLEGIGEADISVMAAHAEKEANPLYPVPRLMTKEELEGFYRQVAAKEVSRHGKQAS